MGKNTVEEIAHFCEEGNTFGALLLSGSWGCGKTYLLEHDVADRLGEGYVMLRISLFGETSVEAVREKIKKSYFNKILETIGADFARVGEVYPGAMESANAWIYKAGDLSGVEAIFSADPSEYIKLEPEILGKTVILVFDDLERCHLSQAEILGCINEYCENLHLKTIIVANEEKIQKNKTKNQEDGKKDYLAYSEIKEKIIVKTVRLNADYEGIITNIFRGYKTKTEGYVDFLNYGKTAVLALIDDCEIKNLRSLRCGFQDFEQLYCLCRKEGLDDEEILKYFTSFVLFVLLAKGGQIAKSPNFGYGLNRLQQKYPGHYYDRFMPNCIKDWVMTGEWDTDEIRTEIRKTHELQNRTSKPQNLLRSMNLLEMDDELVEQGWEAYLQLVYEGALSMDEYVIFLRNLVCARTYAYEWPVPVDMAKVETGVEALFRKICVSERPPVRLRDRIEEAMLKKCTDSERKIYGRIVFFNDSKSYLYGINRNRILTALRGGSPQEIFKCRNYETNCFDREMEEAAEACYEKLENNQRRIAFIDDLTKILRNCGINCSHKDPVTFGSIRALQTFVGEKSSREKENRLKAVTGNYFRRKLEELLAEWPEAMMEET